MLYFAALCRNVEQLLKFLDQHYVVLRTWWWWKHHHVCPSAISATQVRPCCLFWVTVVVTSHMRFQRWMQSSGVSYGSAVRVSASYSTYSVFTSSSSRMRVINHNWSATKQRLHPQSVAEISRHSVLSGDRIRQCNTSSGSRHKDTDQCL